ncbi:MAG: glutamate ligase domain-containing protein [Saccharofermentanales bacterium]
MVIFLNLQKIGHKLKGEIVWFNQRYGNCEHPLYARQNGYLGNFAKNSNTFKPLIAESNLHLLGEYNLENCLAAIAAVKDDVTSENIEKSVREFEGLAHRLEFIRELDQVSYYNSSIDSSPERSKHTIDTFIQNGTPTVLIMGGKDKNSDYSGLGRIVAAATDKLILCGENAGLIEEQVKKEAHMIGKSFSSIDVFHCANYEEAVKRAYLIARPGEAVVLSPSGTSFDSFNNFEERGNLFKDLVNQLP